MRRKMARLTLAVALSLALLAPDTAPAANACGASETRTTAGLSIGPKSPPATHPASGGVILQS